MTDTILRPAVPGDFTALAALLRACDLPTAGVHPDGHGFTVAEGRDGLVGCAGLERYDEDGLLRSVAVAAEARGIGLGARLTAAVVEEARRQRLRALYALTTTAQDYFPRLGFELIGREDVAASVRSSEEFATICPSSAVALRLDLRA